MTWGWSRVSTFTRLTGDMLCAGAAVVALVVLGGCGGGDPTPVAPPVSPLPPIVYLADQDTDGVDELYLATSQVKLNHPLLPNQVVRDFTLLPDGTGVVYRVSLTTTELLELYVVRFATPGAGVKLNAPLTGNDEVATFQVIPDGSGVIYVAANRHEVQRDLYHVSLATPGVPTKLEVPLGSAQYITDYEILPNSLGVVAKVIESGRFKAFYLTRFAQPGSSTLLTPSLPGSTDVFSFAVTPDSSNLVYSILGSEGGIYRVNFSVPQSAALLNAPLPAGDSASYRAALLDGSGVVYEVFHVSAPGNELCLVRFASPGTCMRLDDPLVTKHIENVRITSDNSGVVYMAAPASGGQTELYQARFSAPGVGTKLNGSLPAGVHVQSYALVPDGAGAVFLATEQVFSDPPGKIMVDTELHRTNFAAPGASTVLINPAIAGGGRLRSLW